MGRYTSKLQNIQESNKRLEQRILNEKFDFINETFNEGQKITLKNPSTYDSNTGKQGKSNLTLTVLITKVYRDNVFAGDIQQNGKTMEGGVGREVGIDNDRKLTFKVGDVTYTSQETF